MGKNIKVLTELLRNVTRLIDPVSEDNKLRWLLDPDVKGKLFEKFPKCTLPIKNFNDENLQPYFFVCNRQGVTDPDMIKFSLELCNKLEKLEHLDQDHLRGIKRRLQYMQSRYDKPIPVPYSTPVYKTKNTLRLNKILNRVKKIRNQNGETV